jgi:hypothetical protein
MTTMVFLTEKTQMMIITVFSIPTKNFKLVVSGAKSNTRGTTTTMEL